MMSKNAFRQAPTHVFSQSSVDGFMNRDKNAWELDLLLYRFVAYCVCTAVQCWWRVDSVL